MHNFQGVPGNDVLQTILAVELYYHIGLTFREKCYYDKTIAISK